MGALAYKDRIELFKSPRAFVAPRGFDAALDGLAGPDGALPKKSSPSRESCGRAAGFGAGGAVWDGRVLGMSAVFGRTGGWLGPKSSKRLALDAGAGPPGG